MTTFSRNFQFPEEEEIKYNIAVNVKKYRRLAHITQEQLAVDVGVSVDFIKKLENSLGLIGCKNYTLYKIARVLNTSIDNFFQ